MNVFIKLCRLYSSPQPQPSPYYIPSYPILIPKDKRVVWKLIFQWRFFDFIASQKKWWWLKKAKLSSFFTKHNSSISWFFKTWYENYTTFQAQSKGGTRVTESKAFRDDSLQKMAILAIIGYNLLWIRPNYHHFL